MATNKQKTAQYNLEMKISEEDRMLIPPKSMDYNFGDISKVSQDEYILKYKSYACLNIIPFLEEHAGLKTTSTLFDHGCGLGALGYACGKYLLRPGEYFGFDIREKSIRWLQNAYQNIPTVNFSFQTVDAEHDYIALEHKNEGQKNTKPLNEIKYFDENTPPLDIIWNHSVFTHMFPDDIIQTLQQFRDKLAPSGHLVNTWLMVDEYAKYVLRCGLADRELPHVVQGALTYSLKNPLICTAYPEGDVIGFYKKAGFAVKKILKGSWAGRGNSLTSQDVLIAVPDKSR
jgi:SAM-dependent methyltransferase